VKHLKPNNFSATKQKVVRTVDNRVLKLKQHGQCKCHSRTKLQKSRAVNAFAFSAQKINMPCAIEANTDASENK
jgi:hypothetical protein